MIMVLMLYLIIFSWSFSPFLSSYILSLHLYKFPSISSISPLLTLLYHFYYNYKLLETTKSIIDRKIDEFKMPKVAVVVTVVVIAWVFISFSLISSISQLLILLYHFYCICKLFKITKSIVDRKTDEFKMSEVTVIIAVTMVAWVSTTFSLISSILSVLVLLYHLYNDLIYH